MVNDFSTEYSERSDDDLLLLASDRASLTMGAAAALEDELRRRNLTQSDQAKYQQFVKRSERREAKNRRRRVLGTRTDRRSWVDLFWALVAMALISFAYVMLPSRYHLKPDWQENAVDVMFASVFIAIASRALWRKIGFWMSLVISSTIHLVIVHAWMQRVGNFSRGQGTLAVLPGFVLFFAVYGIVRMLRRNFFGDELRDDT